MKQVEGWKKNYLCCDIEVGQREVEIEVCFQDANWIDKNLFIILDFFYCF